jgi:hypothetical protein
VPESGTISVSLALTGLGQVAFDDIRIFFSTRLLFHRFQRRLQNIVHCLFANDRLPRASKRRRWQPMLDSGNARGVYKSNQSSRLAYSPSKCDFFLAAVEAAAMGVADTLLGVAKSIKCSLFGLVARSCAL